MQLVVSSCDNRETKTASGRHSAFPSAASWVIDVQGQRDPPEGNSGTRACPSRRAPLPTLFATASSPPASNREAASSPRISLPPPSPFPASTGSAPLDLALIDRRILCRLPPPRSRPIWPPFTAMATPSVETLSTAVDQVLKPPSQPPFHFTFDAFLKREYQFGVDPNPDRPSATPNPQCV
jgi:hypothetical protein